MARMSIDDMIGRDTRIDRLARLCGWSRRETRACLEDVWSLCYDRVVPYLPTDDIEVTALRDAVAPPTYSDGFVAALLTVGLARPALKSDRFYTKKDGAKIPWRDSEWRDRLYMSGAPERIGYLLTQKEGGRQGGIKSGESRRRHLRPAFKDPSSTLEGGTKPSASVLPPVPDSASDHSDGPDAVAPGGVISDGLKKLRDVTDRAVKSKAAAVPDRAWKAADYLRGLVLAEDPKAAIGRSPWGDDVQIGVRLGWANTFRLMVERDGRTYEQLADVMRYVFDGQPPGAKFVVQSADALREKFDRIQAVRRNRVEAKSAEKPRQPTLAIPLAGSDRR
jgi:hypothetical protein